MVRISLVSCLQVSGDNGEVWGGYGGRVRSVALATTRDCSGFDPLVFAGLAAAHFAMCAVGVMWHSLGFRRWFKNWSKLPL